LESLILALFDGRVKNDMERIKKIDYYIDSIKIDLHSGLSINQATTSNDASSSSVAGPANTFENNLSEVDSVDTLAGPLYSFKQNVGIFYFCLSQHTFKIRFCFTEMGPSLWTF
jgi:hypothetical protein